MGILAAEEIHTNSFFHLILAVKDAVKLLLFVKLRIICFIQNTHYK